MSEPAASSEEDTEPSRLLAPAVRWLASGLLVPLIVWRFLDGTLTLLTAVPALVAVVLIAVLTLQPERNPPRVRGLEGHSDRRIDLGPLRDRSRWLALVWLVMAAVALALAAFELALVTIALMAGSMATELVVWLFLGWRVRRALVRYAPTVALAYAGRSGGPWQLGMWEPFIVESGERCIVINRHEKYSDAIWEDTNLSSPLVDLGPFEFNNLRFVVVPSIRAMFYVQNARSNANYLNHEAITHVWLNHGDSDKPANFNPRHANYDVLVVTGETAKERYARAGIEIPDENFAMIGRPQIRGIDQTRRDLTSVDDPRILYAPTWAGIEHEVNFSSLRHGPKIVEQMLAHGLTVVFRPHPLSRRGRRHGQLIATIESMLERDAAATGRRHVWGEQASTTWSVVDCANHVDMLVSDVSSVVSDFLPSGKPYAMTMMRTADAEEFRAENSLAVGAYLIDVDLAGLSAVLGQMLGEDSQEAVRLNLRREVLSDRTGEQAASDFAALVRDLAAPAGRRD